MQDFVTPFKVGLVVIVAIAAFAWMAGSVSQSVFRGAEGYRVSAILDDATGLALRSRVMMAGIAVGEIDRIELEGARARVTIRLREEIVLHAGEEREKPDGTSELVDMATLAKKQASLLGDYFLEVTPGLRGPRLRDGDTIPHVIRPIGPDSLFEQMDAIAGNVDALTRDVQQVTSTFAEVFGGDEGVERVDALLGELERMVSALSGIATENRESLGTIVANVEAISADVRQFTATSGQSVEAILADISAMSAELRYVLGQSTGDVSEGIGTLMGTLSSMQLALDNLNYSLENVQVITDRIVDGEGTVGRLINDPSISDEAQTLLANANELVGGVNRLQTWVELRSEYGLGERAFKNYLGLSLRPTPDKAYIFEFVDDPRGRTEITRTSLVTNDPELPPTLYEERTVTSEAFKFSLLLGRRWPLTPSRSWMAGGRFGLIESSGGFGFNLWGFNENLEVRVDLFDFGQNDNVRLKGLSILSLGTFFPDTPILSNLFLQAGVDDLLNPGPRDLFFGGGLRFNDRDLKTVLIAAPAPSP